MDVRGNVIVLYNWTLGYKAVSNWIANHKQPISHTNPTLTLTLKTLQRTAAPLNKSSLLYNLYLVGADFFQTCQNRLCGTECTIQIEFNAKLNIKWIRSTDQLNSEIMRTCFNVYEIGSTKIRDLFLSLDH